MYFSKDRDAAYIHMCNTSLIKPEYTKTPGQDR